MDLWLSGSTVLLVSRVRGSLAVCLVSLTMVEPTIGVAADWLLCCPSGCAPVVSNLPAVFPLQLRSYASGHSPAIFLSTLSSISLTFPANCPGISRPSVRTSRVFDYVMSLQLEASRTRCWYQSKSICDFLLVNNSNFRHTVTVSVF